jgi:hypothetical protein
VALVSPGLGAGDEQGTVYDRFEHVSLLRAEGRYDEAIEVLLRLIDKPGSDGVRDRAYNMLVATLLIDLRAEAEAREVAEEALGWNPGLTADPAYVSPRVNEFYDRVRDEIFASITITTDPDSCEVYVDEDFLGYAPFRAPYLPAGHSYTVTISKPGYRDRSIEIEAVAGTDRDFNVSLEREGRSHWWLIGIGSAVVATSIALTAALSSGDDGGAGSLPGPPPPP